MATGNGSTNGKAPEVSEAERLSRVQDAHEAMGKASKAEAVKAVWAEHYLAIGHRVLGRLLLGQTVEQAMRTRRSKQAAS